MEKIIIKNFAPIKHVELAHIQKFNSISIAKFKILFHFLVFYLVHFCLGDPVLIRRGADGVPRTKTNRSAPHRTADRQKGQVAQTGWSPPGKIQSGASQASTH